MSPAAPTVERGQRVQIAFTGRLLDGSEFYSSEAEGPLEFTAGSDEVMRGLADGVLGMQVGERRTVTVPTEDAFGARDESLKTDVPRRSLPADAQIGDRVELQLDAGDQAPAWIAELHDECAHLDGNHPLAGQTLVFTIELLVRITT